MKTLRQLVKRLPPLNSLVRERDELFLARSQLAREKALLIQERDRLIAATHDYFLAEARGVIHIGANLGQERYLYAEHDLDVVWIEPIDDVFLQLKANLADFPNQKALQYLVTDADDTEYEFHIASNAGASSSIFSLAKHQEIWPEIHYVKSIRLKSITFASLLRTEDIDSRRYDALVMDTQGSELLVLRGMGELVKNFKFLKTEAADFEIYEGCCTLEDLESYLRPLGFSEVSKKRFASKQGVGNCYDVVFERTAD